MHSKGLLHNDLHGNNILIRCDNSPSIIDFGKSTLADHSLLYNIMPGSIGAKKYKNNTKIHRHLGHELRNIIIKSQKMYFECFYIFML